jgi:hypothetical protein
MVLGPTRVPRLPGIFGPPKGSQARLGPWALKIPWVSSFTQKIEILKLSYAIFLSSASFLVTNACKKSVPV